MTPSRSRQGFVMLLITAFAWGLNWPVLKLALAEWPPLSFRLFSSMSGVILMAGVAIARGETLRPPRGQWGRLIVAGVLNVFSFVGLATLSLLWLEATEAAIIAYTMPIWAALFAWPILGERPTVWRVAGLVSGLAGVAVLLAGQFLIAPSAALVAKLPGIACILATALMFALGAVLTKRYPINLPPASNVAWQVLFGSLPLIAGALLFDRAPLAHVGPLGWACLAYVAVIALCASYLAWFRALKLLPASMAAIGTLLVPVIGVLSSGLVLGETIGVREIAALCLTIGGVVLASRGAGGTR
jgi:drug/metabolite transporter (DMT)-like permease